MFYPGLQKHWLVQLEDLSSCGNVFSCGLFSHGHSEDMCLNKLAQQHNRYGLTCYCRL